MFIDRPPPSAFVWPAARPEPPSTRARSPRAELLASSALVTATRRRQLTTADVVEEMDATAAMPRPAICVTEHVPDGEAWRFVERGVEWVWMNAAGLARTKTQSPDAFLGRFPVEVVWLERLRDGALRARLLRMAAAKLGPRP